MSITIEVLFMKDGDPRFTFTTDGRDARKITVRQQQEIIWTIASASTPGTVFPDSLGVVFLPSANALAEWPFSQPSHDQGQYRVLDPVPSTGPTITYSYRVTVLHDGEPFSHDPDVTNEPPG
jgi:hypothetical protein